MSTKVKRYDCGVTCIHSGEDGFTDFTEVLRGKTQSGDYGFALAWFSKATCTGEDIAGLMAEGAPGIEYAACSTAGEITPDGLSHGGIQVVLFPASAFQIEAMRLSAPDDKSIQEIAAEVTAFKTAFQSRSGHGETHFAISLMDGMSYMEEATTAAIHWGLDDLPLVGGSAGDDLNFDCTTLIRNGEIFDQCAILLLVSTSIPVHVFKTENFVPTSEKLVVTHSDPERRIVHEFNAAPAARVYAGVTGADPGSLTPQSFASHPLVMKVGGEYYCRSIQKVNEDGSLSFFCAIDDGIVLTVAEPTGMARSTEECFSGVREELGDVDFILGFDCVLRQIDARNRQITHKISELYRANNVVGFNTYGEQYRSVHLNQTLTGVAFGKPSRARDQG
jgi:hypothetical protein